MIYYGKQLFTLLMIILLFQLPVPTSGATQIGTYEIGPASQDIVNSLDMRYYDGNVYSRERVNSTLRNLPNTWDLISTFKLDGNTWHPSGFINLTDSDGKKLFIDTSSSNREKPVQKFGDLDFYDDEIYREFKLSTENLQYSDYYITKFDANGTLIDIKGPVDPFDDMHVNSNYVVLQDHVSLKFYDRMTLNYVKEVTLQNSGDVQAITEEGIWMMYYAEGTRSSYGRSSTDPGYFVYADLDTGKTELRLNEDPNAAALVPGSIAYENEKLIVFYNDYTIYSFETSGAVATTYEDSSFTSLGVTFSSFLLVITIRKRFKY